MKASCVRLSEKVRAQTRKSKDGSEEKQSSGGSEAKAEERKLKNGLRIKENQANKSIGRMPWHQAPMKDVASCEKPR